MKKGFTLIELLSVVIILAIISLIAVPRLTGIIDETKYKASLESAQGYIKSVKIALTSNELKVKNGIYYSKDIDIDMKKSSLENGIVTIKNNDVTRARLCINNISIDYKNKNFEKSINDYCGKTRVTLYSNNTKLKTLSEVKNYSINTTGKTNVYCNNGSIPKGNNKLTVEYPIGNTVCVISSSLKNTQNNMKLNEYSILMLNDENVNTIGLNISKNKEILFDLNGKKIKSINKEDTTESKSTYSNSYYIFNVAGSLIINDETNKGLVDAYIGSEAIMINSSGSVFINGGNYIGRRAINNNGNLEINDGHFTSKLYDVIGSYKKSNTTIYDGEFECNVNSITMYSADDSNLNIYGGVFTNTESIVLFARTKGTINIEALKRIYFGSYKYTTVDPDLWTPASIKNYTSSGINIKGKIADICNETKGVNTEGICIYAKLRSVVNDNLDANSFINIDGATIISDYSRAVNTYSSTINLINTSIKGDSSLSVDIGENNVDYKTGLINVCRSTISSDSHDVSVQSSGNVRYSSNVSIDSKKFYDINKPTHIKMDDSIKCK